MSDQLHVACSTLSNTIYCGGVQKDGMTWRANKTDVTGEACAAVAQYALAKGGEIVVTANGKPKYTITVQEHAPHNRDRSGADMGILTSEWVSAVEDDGRVGLILRDMNGERREMRLNCTQEQWEMGCRMFNHGRGHLIQRAFDFLTDDEREFLLTGMTPDEWDDMWSEEA